MRARVRAGRPHLPGHLPARRTHRAGLLPAGWHPARRAATPRRYRLTTLRTRRPRPSGPGRGKVSCPLTAGPRRSPRATRTGACPLDDRRTPATAGQEARRSTRPCRAARTRSTSGTRARACMTAKPAATAPTTRDRARLAADVRRVFIGKPLASDQETEERLSKKKALAIFSSDAISSSAYATEEILTVLIVAGAVALHGEPRDRHRHRDPARGGLHQLPPDRPGVSQRRRRVRGRSRQLRQDGGDRGRGRAARGLHPDGRGVDLVGRGADHLRRSRPCCPSPSGCASCSSC